jgi:hypothetical protein
MAAFASRILTALWKVTHGFTLSSEESAIKKLEFPLTNILLSFHTIFLLFHDLYCRYVTHVTNKKSFEQDEEFQIGYEQPPMESQIMAFGSVMEIAEDKCYKILPQMKNFAERSWATSQEEAASGQGGSEPAKEVRHSDQPNTVHDVLLYITIFVQDMRALCHRINTYFVRDP